MVIAKDLNNLKLLLKLFKYVGQYKVKVVWLILLSFVGVGFEVLKPLPIKFIVDNVLSDNKLPTGIINFFNYFGGVPGRLPLLSLCIASMVVFVAGNACISIYASHLTTKVCQQMVHELSLDLFDKVQRLSLSFYSKNKVGELLQRISGDVYVIYSLVASIMLPFITAVATLTGMFYVMTTINLLLACTAITVVPALAILLYAFYKPMNDSTEEQYDLLGRLSAFMQQSLNSIKIIQAYSNENYTRDKFKKYSQLYSHAYVRSTKISMIYVILTGVITGLVSALVIGIGAYNGLQGKISIGELFVFLGYISAIFGPVNSLSNTIAAAVTVSARSKRIFELMDSREKVSEKPDALELEGVRGDIELQNVDFSYGSGSSANKILKDFNLKVSAGQVVGIVGPTGAGKTSLISLLLRFYDPSRGKIFMDGIDISTVKIASLRKHISLVLQDSFILPVTIKENIAFGNPDATTEQIIDAAKATQAHDFITRLPHGYDAVVSEGGISLSGGEKQRISLARALLRKTPVLILDEPTSALDVETESRIFKMLKKYASSKTVFIISHRLSTIRNADIIVTIEDGVITEKGTHENLISQNKLYAQLYNFQHV